MSESADELSIQFEEGGLVVTKQLDKKVLSSGAWATVIFKYQDWDARKQMYSPTKFSIRRYQKRDGLYKQRSKFNLSSIDQAQKLIEALNGWMK